MPYGRLRVCAKTPSPRLWKTYKTETQSIMLWPFECELDARGFFSLCVDFVIKNFNQEQSIIHAGALFRKRPLHTRLRGCFGPLNTAWNLLLIYHQRESIDLLRQEFSVKHLDFFLPLEATYLEFFPVNERCMVHIGIRILCTFHLDKKETKMCGEWRS